MSKNELYNLQRGMNKLARAAYKVIRKDTHQSALANVKAITKELQTRKR